MHYPKIPTDRRGRRLLLEQELKIYTYKKFYCPALRVKVRIWPQSISETAWHASKSVLSTKLALRLPYIIKNASVIVPVQTPKRNTRQIEMRFKKLAILKCGIRGLGTAKLTVGYRYAKFVLEYCITDIRNEN